MSDILSEYHRDHTHHESNDDDREPTCESHSSDELICEIHDEEWYSEPEYTECEPPDRERDEPEYTSDNEIHESEYRCENQERGRPWCERHSREISIVDEGVYDSCCEEESEYESHSIWG